MYTLSISFSCLLSSDEIIVVRALLPTGRADLGPASSDGREGYVVAFVDENSAEFAVSSDFQGVINPKYTRFASAELAKELPGLPRKLLISG